MRFKQFILLEDFNAEEIAQIIQRDCEEYLKYFKSFGEDVFLFRGIKHSQITNFFIKKDVRSDRQPVDMPKEFHNAIDEAFKNKFGIKFRSNSIFVTGKQEIAEDYGIAMLVFPIGQFNYLWSPKIKDAFTYFDNELNQQIPRGFDEVSKFVPEKDKLHIMDENNRPNIKIWSRAIYDYIVSGEANYIMNKRLKDANRNESEIMINCNSYYALFYSHKVFLKHIDKFSDEEWKNKTQEVLNNL